MLEQECEAEADGPAAGHGDAQHGFRRRVSRPAASPGGARQHGRPHVGGLETEDPVPDRDQVAWLELALGYRRAVDPGAVAAASVIQDIAPSFGAQFSMDARRQRGGENHVVLVIATEGDRPATDREALSDEVTLKPHDGGDHRIWLPLVLRPRRRYRLRGRGLGAGRRTFNGHHDIV